MYRICLLLFSVFCLSLQIAAQCSFNLKETKRQVFSNSFTYAQFEDFDGDGLEDLLGYTLKQTGSDLPGHQIYFYKRLTADSFDTTARTKTITNNADVVYFVTGDVNADGKKDLIITNDGNPRTVVTYLNDGSGNFSNATPPTEIGFDSVWAAADLNNDGRADLVTTVWSSVAPPNTTTFAYRLAQPDNTFGAAVNIKTVTGWLWGGKSYNANFSSMHMFSYPVLVDDFNNDGAKDIAFSVLYGGAGFYVLTNNGSLTFTETSNFSLNYSASGIKAYDLNNDGKKDFIGHPSDQDVVSIAINNGNNTFMHSTMALLGAPNNVYEGYYRTKETSVADFDNDGDQDVFFPGLLFNVLFINNGHGTFTQQRYDPSFMNDAVTNLNNDGKGDFLSLVRPLIDGGYRWYDGSNWRYYYLYNAVSFKQNVCMPPGQTKKIDFDGNGNSEVAYWDPPTGNWRTAVPTVQWGEGALGDVPVPNDYDGDGKTDHGIYRRSTGMWWVKQSSNGVNFAVPFGTAEDKPVPADYDGDGKADLAVFRPSNGDWYFFFSATLTYGAVHFGISEDKPVPADYDGDGRADVSVYRPSTGVWYRINSTDLSIFIFQFGISTDIPIPADYDGDGKANVAVFRNGVWYVLRDNLTAAIFNWGTTGDIPYFDDIGTESRICVLRRSSSQFYCMTADFYPFTYAFTATISPGEIFLGSVLPLQ